MPQSYMICSRDEVDGEFDISRAPMRYFISNAAPDQLIFKNQWVEKTEKEFAKELIDVAQNFPFEPPENNEAQKHLSLFIHGYNNTWEESVERYAKIQSKLYDDPGGLGVLILYAWPSDGSPANYQPDRVDADACAGDLAEFLVKLHDYIITMQRGASITGKPDSERLCRAKVSVIAHSMGGFVIQRALVIASKRLNNPQLITLVHQLAFVAADIDNDIFQKYQSATTDGILLANMCYRVAGLFSGLDAILGASAGLKHFGIRRLGRSGLADRTTVVDNVFDIDVSDLIKDTPGSPHSAVFESPSAMNLLRRILIGVDRKHL